MIISEKTKISEILETDKNAVDIIASVNRNFSKLKNPFLRKLFASRVSVKDAAEIGGVTPDEILKKLEESGFKVKFSNKNSEKNEYKKSTINMKKENVIKLDVRPILATGTDPYHAIMDTLKEMNENEILLIINTFEPVPLLNKLKSRGYEYETERPDEDTVYTYLQKTGISAEEEKQEDNDEKPDFDETEKKYAGKMHEIDVRDLEMPMPMVKILEETEKIKDDEALYVHHKRLPQYLLPELETRGWVYVNKEIDENNMKFIIYKK